MSSTYTANLGLRKPSHRDPETIESWDAVLNNNFDIIDAYLGKKDYTYQNYILNVDTTCQSLDKLDIALKAIDLRLTTVESNLVTWTEIIDYTRLNRKDVFHPEYAGATFALAPGGANVGNFITDSEMEVVGGNSYRFNHYKWVSAEASLQNYDVLLQWRLPATFLNWQAKALTIDINTESSDPAESRVDVELHKDGTVSGSVSTKLDKVSSDGKWKAERLGNEVISFVATDPVLIGLAAGDTLNIRITLSSKDNYAVKLGAVTFLYKG